MILLIAIVGICILIFRPKDLLNKVFRVEEIELLHRRNRKEAEDAFTVGTWSRRALWRISLYGLTLWSMAMLILPAFMPTTAAACFATILGALWFAFSLRLWQKSRATVVPLYLALTRIAGSRWSALDSPMKWVRVWPDEIRIRLPRDQHTTPLMVRSIQDLVTSRLRGQWTMKTDLPGFLLTFSASRPVPVSVGVTSEGAGDGAIRIAKDTPAPPMEIQILSEEGNEGPW